MNRVNPLFSARQFNTIGQYERFYHVKSYLRQRSALFQGVESNRRLMADVGYRRYEKFARRRPQWDDLHRDVPVRYLEAIGAVMDVLAVAAEADIAEFRAALDLPRFPRFAIVRHMPAIYGNLEFPEGVSEKEALVILQRWSNINRKEACISWPQLMATYVRPDGVSKPYLFEPRLRIIGGFLLAGSDGRAIGTSSLGC